MLPWFKDLSETGKDALIAMAKANERLLWENCSVVIDGQRQADPYSPYYKGWKAAIDLLVELQDG